MKKKISLLSIVLFCFFLNGFAQGNTKLYIVINQATWCKYCKAHGERVKDVLNEYVSGKEIILITNDVTDKESKKKTASQFNELGLSEYMNKHTEPAIIYVIDAKTKKTLDGFNIKISSEEIQTRLKQNLLKVN